MNTASTIGGRYKLQAFVPGQPPRVLAGWFNNLITNYGMDLMSGSLSGHTDMWKYCSVGTGNAPPAFSNINLANRKTTTSQIVKSEFGREEDYIWQRKTYQFAQGAAAGNLAEVGVGRNGSGAELFSRALIKDAQGVPTTVTVLPDEVLQVVWEIRHYFPSASTSTLTIAGSGTHDISVALFKKNETPNVHYGIMYISYGFSAYETVYSGVAGLVPETQSTIPNTGTGSLYNLPSENYVSGSFTRKKKLILPVDSFNFPAGISGISFVESSEYSAFNYQVYIDPPIMKTPEKQLILMLSQSWARG